MHSIFRNILALPRLGGPFAPYHRIIPFVTFPYDVGPLDRSDAFPHGQTALRPVLTATLRAGDRHTDPFSGLVDSGADYCVFPADFAKHLGLDYESLPSAIAHGLGEDQQMRFATVTLEVEKLGTWEIYAGFSDLWNGRGIGMLGQLGFFDRFKITFDSTRRIFEVREVLMQTEAGHPSRGSTPSGALGQKPLQGQ